MHQFDKLYDEGLLEFFQYVKKKLEDSDFSGGSAGNRPMTADGRRTGFERYADVSKKPLPDGLRVHDHYIVASSREIHVRTYLPIDHQPSCMMVYFHGGGFVSGSIQTHELITSQVAHGAKIAVASVHYRRAPENPYPNGLEDCYAAVQWFAEGKHLLDIDPDCLILGGDSAGANLAVATSMLSSVRNGPKIDFQVLFYPGPFDLDLTKPSYLKNIYDPSLNIKDLEFFFNCYLHNKNALDPFAMPLNAPSWLLKQMPPTVLWVAEHDPMRDDGVWLGKKLQSAGIEVDVHIVPKVNHGFLRAFYHSAYVRDQMALICKDIQRRLPLERAT